MLLNMTMKWPQCYKDILSSLWCFDNWTGKDAKIFDECELSSSEEVEILKYELKQEEAEKYWYGTGLDQSEGCWPNFIGGSSTSMPLLENMLDHFYMYVFDALELGPKFKSIE